MNLNFSEEELSFQEEVKDFLRKELKPELVTTSRKTSAVFTEKEVAMEWQAILAKKGWLVPSWPEEYGGTNWTQAQKYIFSSECAKAGAPNLIPMGLAMIGPLLLGRGTKEQKDYYIPRIINGDDYWCQGYSEPGAGSDLAGVSTTATSNDNETYIINGSKIWTSEADKADWMYCLVKTDKTKKHDGISFVLIDMKQDEITTNRIQFISGVSPFCQVFYDDAKALKSHCIGGENKGWPVAKSLLMHERTMMSDMESEGAVDISPSDLLKNCSEFSDKKLLRNEITKHELRNELIDLTMQRVKEESQFGFSEAALTLKYLSTEELQLRWELNIKSLGMGGLLVPGKGSEMINDVVKSFFYSKAYTIAGGSSEVQLNIISKNILGLPS